MGNQALQAVHRKTALDSPDGTTDRANRIPGSGEEIPEPTRSFFESRFDQDFGDVRIHTGTGARRAAGEIGAEAFTVGDDIVVGSETYRPTTPTGKRLLAHELVHVVQQRRGTRPEPPIPDEAHEREAATVARRAARGADVRVARAVGPSLARQASLTQSLDPAQLGTEELEQEIRLLREWLMEHQESSQKANRARRTLSEFEAELIERTESKTVAEEEESSAYELAQAGLLATGEVLQSVAAPEGEYLRSIYNKGAQKIAEKRTQLKKLMEAGKMTEQEVAKKLSAMRHQLAKDVREAGSTLYKKGAEAFDRVRGQARPTYETLKARGKTDADIIKSASKTNKFINNLPTGLRWTGRGLWFVSAGISTYVVLSAEEGERGRVLQEEVGGALGSVGGAGMATALCLGAGVATQGLGLILCGLAGGAIGYEVGRRMSVWQFLDIAPHEVPGLAGRLYRVEGALEESDFFVFSIVHKRVSAGDNVIVLATGQRSGQMVGGRGHYRKVKVVPANENAVEAFGGTDPRWLPRRILQHVPAEELYDEGG